MTKGTSDTTYVAPPGSNGWGCPSCLADLAEINPTEITCPACGAGLRLTLTPSEPLYKAELVRGPGDV